MEWTEYRVLIASEFVDLVAELFHRLGSGGVVIEEQPGLNGDGEACLSVKAYFPAAEDKSEAIKLNLQAIRRDHGADCRLFSGRVKNEDWENTWKEFFHSFRLGRRIVISPSWEEYQAGSDDVVIRIDPDMAFGTGQHATTRFCLEQMERHMIPGSRVLDAGCGSGILAIAAARLGAGTVTGIDNDELAVRIATENVVMNGVQAQVNILPGDLNALEAEKTPAFDIVVANLTDQLLTGLTEGLYAALVKGGKLIAAGINHERWAALKDRLLASGFALAEEAADGEWIGAVLMK